MFAKPANVFVITGAVSRLAVLDCDDDVALNWWRQQLGDVLDQTACVQTGQGYHFYFSLEEGESHRGRSSDGTNGTGKWDLRADGGGVVAPPSIHPSGRVYAWSEGRGPDSLCPAPAALWESGAEAGDGGTVTRSLLSHLLTNPPQSGGRNNWLAKVAGHYALHIPHYDAYELMVREAAEKLTPPLPEDEIAKLIPSVWRAEQAKEGRAAPELEEGGQDAWRASLIEPKEETGWLVSGGVRILTQIREKIDDEWVTGLAPWLDCDIRVLGIVQAEQDRVFGVELRFPDNRRVEDHLSSKAISDPKALNAWLASHGASIGTPDAIWPSRMRESTRLLRYLNSQDAEPLEAADALGWHLETGVFITHEGIITANGPGPFAQVRPNPAMKGWAPYRYGHAGREEAAEILREILTFHDETVTAVFGSWWAATFLKPQLAKRASQFPFMALEAPSESGKTTGFFPLMLQLGGNTAGQSIPTRAALRDYLSAHNNGIVWVDDLDDPDYLGELLRTVTVGGELVKKGDGNHAQVVARLRAALVISGESLGLQDQKALIDRAVLLDVPSPRARSGKDGGSQWDDIVEFRHKHPDLTKYAGSIVESALQHADLVESLKDYRLGEAGRHSDTLAIVRLGADLLQRMCGGRQPWISKRVDAWAGAKTDQYTGNENVLTLKLLPAALSALGWPSRPSGSIDARSVATPAFISDDGLVWFSPRLLAQWWEREPPGNKKINPRVESAGALEQQARDLGLGGSRGVDRKNWRLLTGEGTQRYWRATDEISQAVIARSQGREPNDPSDI